LNTAKVGITEAQATAITTSTSDISDLKAITGLVKSNGTTISAATAGTDYALPNANTTGTASNVTGTIAIGNGGTGAITAAGALTSLGAQSASNLSTNVLTDAASDIKYPSVKAVKTYVDTNSTINAISTITANYTALITDYTILSNSTAGGFTLTLPDAGTATGKVYVIRKTDETDHLLNFSPALKLTETTEISSINFPKTIRVQSNGSSWYVID
jgi:hypothetical protein